MPIKSYSFVTNGLVAKSIWGVGDSFILNAPIDGAINIWDDVTTGLINLPITLPGFYGVYVRWLVQFLSLGNVPGEAMFDGNPPSYKRGYFSPSLGIYALERNLIQFDAQTSKSYRFAHSSGQPEAGIGAIAGLPFLGVTDEIMFGNFGNTRGLQRGLDYGSLYSPVDAIATRLRWKLNKSAYSIGVVYSFYLFDWEAGLNPSSRVLVQV